MNLDELKTLWKVYDRKLQSTQLLNEKIIVSMISERSVKRFTQVRKQYILAFGWMMVCLTAGFAILLGNPFDYTLIIQYIPITIYCLCLMVLVSALIKSYIELQHIVLNQSNLDTSLKKIITVYEKPQRFIKYTLIIFLVTQVVLFPLSFLPHSLDRLGGWLALAERLIPIITIGALIIFVAYKLGAFKERQGEKFKEDLNELQQLKQMSSELTAEIPEHSFK